MTLKLFRFTFVRGSYDVGQAVVMAETLAEAEDKLTRACRDIPSQGWPTRYSEWNVSHIVRNDSNDDYDEPYEITGDVAFTRGVDG